MIMHTIVPAQILFSSEQSQDIQSKCISHNGVILDVTTGEEGGYKINRIISTDLKAYLNPALQPQKQISINNEK